MLGRVERNWSSGPIEQKCLLGMKNLKLIWVNGLSSILFEVFSVSTAQHKSFFIEENKLKGNINYEKIFWCTTCLFASTWGEEKRRGANCLSTWKATANLESSPSALIPFHKLTHIMCSQVDGVDFKPLQEDLLIIQFCLLLWVYIQWLRGCLRLWVLWFFRFKVVVNKTWMLANPNLCALLLWVIFNPPRFSLVAVNPALV